MKTGAFTKTVAESFGIAEPTVKLVVRELKDAGLFSMGLRGRYSPDVTAQDAAHTVISLLGTDRPARAVEAVEAFRQITYDPQYSSGEMPPQLESFDYMPELAEVLEGIISFRLYTISGSLHRISLQTDENTAEISICGKQAGQLQRLIFTPGYSSKEEVIAASKTDAERKIIRNTRAVLGPQLLEIAAALKRE